MASQMNIDPQTMGKPPLVSGTHLRPLDALRGLASLYITIHHAIQLAGSSIDKIPLPFKAIVKFFSYGHYSVDVFIVLSGFCLMLPIVRNGGIMRESTIEFYVKRARRILPPYYLALLLSILAIFFLIGKPTGEAWDMSLSIQPHDVISHILLIHDLFRETRVTINPVFWSIAVEWRIYLLFPAIVLMWKKWGSLKTTVLLSGISCLFPLIFSKIPSLNLDPIGPSPHFVALFLLGMLACDLLFIDSELNRTLRDEFPWNETMILSLLLSLPTYQFFSVGGQSWMIADLLMGFFSFSLLMMVFLGRSSILSTILNLRLLTKLGNFSYSLYLLHMPCLQLVIQYVIKPFGLNSTFNFLLLIFAALPFSFIVSYAFFLICERPFLSQSAKRSLAID